MKRFRFAAFCALALLLLAPSARAAETLTLEQAVLRALERNPSMQAARAELAGAGYGRKAAMGSFGPALTTGYGFTHRDHRKPRRDLATSEQDIYAWNFNAHQDLFTGFQLLSTYERAALSEESAASSIRNAELSLVQSVQQNFLALLKARADVKSGEDSVARLQEQLKVTTAFYDVGLKPRLDVLQAEADLAKAEDTLLQARNSVATQIARLNTLLDMPLDADADYVGQLEYLPCSLALDQALAGAMKNRPDLDIAQKSVEIARKDKKIVDSAFYPSLGADYDQSRTGNGMDVQGSPLARTEWSEWSVSVSASWTFFEWGKTLNESRQAGQTITQMEAERRNLEQEVTYEVKANHLKIGEAAERIKVTRKALDQAREAYRMAVARYQAQVGTNADVLDSQFQLSRAEADLTQALADYQLAVANLYVSIGEKNPGLMVN
ncbi:MAG: TolC family protein [Thermodesulfobacteriota bacterium]